MLKTASIVVGAAFLFGFAMVPIYRIACEHVFGIKLAEGAASEAKAASLAVDESRIVRVQFISSVNSKLPWKFAAEVPSVEVHPGKLTEAWFDATNNAAEPIVGNAGAERCAERRVALLQQDRVLLLHRAAAQTR